MKKSDHQPASIKEVYIYLKRNSNYKDGVRRRVCKIILGSSVIRVFEKKTKKDLLDCLLSIDVTRLYKISSITAYDKWHSEKIEHVYNCLLTKNKEDFQGYFHGLKWGHATKIFNLYIGHLIFYSPFFSDSKYIERIYGYLHVPLDSKVFAILKSFGISTPEAIKNISKEKYYELQEIFRKHAKAQFIAPLTFDEYAWAIS